jgi:hypothetical protein
MAMPYVVLTENLGPAADDSTHKCGCMYCLIDRIEVD